MYRRAGTVIHKSTAYRAWLTTSHWRLAAQVKGFKRIGNACAVEIFAGPMHASRDIDNIGKPILDFLQYAHIVTNDKLVRDLRIAADCDSVPRNTAIVTVKEIGRAA